MNAAWRGPWKILPQQTQQSPLGADAVVVHAFNSGKTASVRLPKWEIKSKIEGVITMPLKRDFSVKGVNIYLHPKSKHNTI